MKKTVKKVISPAKEKSEGVEGKELPNIPRSIPEKTVSSWLGLASLRSHGEVVIVSFLCGVLLMGIGVVLVYSASFILASQRFADGLYFFKKQTLNANNVIRALKN